MQGVYYTDKNYIYESSVKSILSIRYATDGFSFCVHDEKDQLVVFAHQPFKSILRTQSWQKWKTT